MMPESKKYLSVNDIADLLQVSIDTVRRWIRKGKLPALDFGGQYRVAPNDLQTFLEQHRKQVPSTEEKPPE